MDGSTVVVLANVYGSGSKSLEYTPEQEWQSTDGGASFKIVNGGKSVAEGNVDGDTFPLSGVLVPGTELLGYGWNAAVAPPTFHEFPLNSPPECTEETGGCPSGFATLEPKTNPDQVTNGGGQFASQLGAHSGVLGIFNTLFSDSGPLECPGGTFGTAYAYASGEQTTTNNYNKSPEEADSAWKVPIAQADCSVDEPAVAGGPSGFGVLRTTSRRTTSSTTPSTKPTRTSTRPSRRLPRTRARRSGRLARRVRWYLYDLPTRRWWRSDQSRLQL